MAKETNKEKNKEKKENKNFFKELKAELKRVNWPTFKQLVNNTIAVLTIVIITAVIVFILDLIFENLNKYGVETLKTFVRQEETSHRTPDFDFTFDTEDSETGDENPLNVETEEVPEENLEAQDDSTEDAENNE